MKEFKEKLKVNTVITAIACVILAVATVLTFDTELGIVPLAGLQDDGWRGFVSGASFGLLIAFGIDLVRSILALRNEEKLKKMYIKDNDERDRQIWNYARSSGARATLILSVAAAVAVGFCNRTIGLTIIACAFVQSLLILGFVFYYKRKF